MLKSLRIISLSLLLVSLQVALAQSPQGRIIGQTQEGDLNTITTAVPFLVIAPDTRSGGMGEAGVSISADANAMHWNPSKLAFAEKDFEVSLSYSPWLRGLVRDMNLAYLSAYTKIDDNQALGGSLRFFSLGDIQFTDDFGNQIRNFEPTEFALDLGYSIKLSKRFSGGIASRFIYSNLTGGIVTQGGGEAQPGTAFAVDVSGFYTNDDIRIGQYDAIFNWGFNISNIGSKISYTTAAQRDFIPINLRVGPSLTLELDDFNSLTFTTDFNKLLVPTNPIFQLDSLGNIEADANGDPLIASGRDPNVGVAAGIFGSFSDAPGDVTIFENGDVEVEPGSVLREELREINIAAGLEYWYADQFAIRAGYFREHPTKGAREFVTLGFGLRYNVFSIDASYLIATINTNPLANTLRLTLRMSLDKGQSASGGGAEEG